MVYIFKGIVSQAVEGTIIETNSGMEEGHGLAGRHRAAQLAALVSCPQQGGGNMNENTRPPP